MMIHRLLAALSIASVTRTSLGFCPGKHSKNVWGARRTVLSTQGVDDLAPREEDLDIAFLIGGDEDEVARNKPSIELANVEKAWRFAKKTLLRIGSKGATLTHGNSLRQLLLAHTIVKVKVNSRKYGSLEESFLVLRQLAEEAGAESGIELVQFREVDKVILFGLPGTLERIENGDFPPVRTQSSDEVN